MSPALLACAGVSIAVGKAPRRRVLIENLSWRVAEGERWVILGPNGAGKSTLLAALAGVRDVEAGSILYSDAPLASLDVTARAGRRALVTDRWHDPFSASVRQTVLTARYRLGDEESGVVPVVDAALTRLDCTRFADDDVHILSRGERQRVAIATALAQETPLVLLDEPIAHQDPRHQALVLDALRAWPGATVVASLHDINAALRFATHALLLTGRGEWNAGPAGDVLTAPRMSRLFETPFAAWQGAVAGNSTQVLVQYSPDARDSPPL